jgi:hypothetical protein
MQAPLSRNQGIDNRPRMPAIHRPPGRICLARPGKMRVAQSPCPPQNIENLGPDRKAARPVERDPKEVPKK